MMKELKRPFSDEPSTRANNDSPRDGEDSGRCFGERVIGRIETGFRGNAPADTHARPVTGERIDGPCGRLKIMGEPP